MCSTAHASFQFDRYGGVQQKLFGSSEFPFRFQIETPLNQIRTLLHGGLDERVGVGFAESVLYDVDGRVGRAAQALVVERLG